MEADFFEEWQVPSGLLTGITFSVSTETEKEKLSVLVIDAVSEVTNPKMGVPNPSSQCLSCGSKDLKSCEGHFGVIKFPITILHPYYISEVANILNKVCPGCKSIRKGSLAKGKESSCRENIRNSCKYCSGNSMGWYPPLKFKVSSKEIFRKAAIIAEVNEKLLYNVRKRGFKKSMAADFWDIIPKDEEQEESTMKPNRRVLSHAQVHYLLKDIDPEFIRRYILKIDSIFLNSFPVTPNCHRVTEVTHAFSNGQRLVFDDRTRAYKKLVDFRGMGNELSLRVLDCLKTSKINPEKIENTDAATAQQKRVNDLTCSSSGLRWVKDVVLGKRNDHSFRMVVVGDPNLKLSEIGIPCHIAEKLQISEHLTCWNWENLTTTCEVRLLAKGEIHVRREGKFTCIRRIKDLRIGDIIYRPLCNGDTVLINRPPSIHQHSLIALSVKVLPVIANLAINPLCCPPFRGDFDGDCLHGYVPQSVETRVELNELIALDKQLTNAQTGRNLLSLSQDSLVAAHLVMEDGVFLNRFQMQQLAMYRPHRLSFPAFVRAPSHDSYLWTGKQLISMLLPGGFDHDFPSNDVRIRDGELVSSEGSSWLRDTDGNLFQSLIRHCPTQFLDFLHTAQEVLCEWLTMRGLSVSLFDLYLCPDSFSHKNMMNEVMWGLKEAEHTSNMKQMMVDSCRDFLSGNDEEDKHAMIYDVERFCYEKQRSAMLSQASADTFKRVFRDIQSLFYKYASNDNSLLAMFKAGSKGNLLKLVQHSMCLGLQHSLVPLSFRLPHQLSCSAWNKQKVDDASEYAKRYIPSAVVDASFLTGLNPAECFVHSVTSRDSSFSDNADLPGTLTRRLMFFMRDIYVAYDGTVRNAYGDQLVQFSYGKVDETSTPMGSTQGAIEKNCGVIGGQPVGSMAACALSEAAYSALDQPISLLQKSPLLNLKNALECGLKKGAAHQTVSLFLSNKLGRQRHGFEYGALEVQNHLKRLLLSDIVSCVRIIFSPQGGGKVRISPWICHFHIDKEIVKQRSLKLHCIINTLLKRCNSTTNFPDVQIMCKECSVADIRKEKEETFCITVTIVEHHKSSATKLETIQDLMIPFFLETVVKGFMEIKKVEILWNDKPKIPKSNHSCGELYLRVSMSGGSDRKRLWNLLLNDCLPIMDLIDWKRSHPDNMHEFCLAYGIDAGWKFFLNNLESAISDVGKTILPEHLLLVANSLSITGEFVGLNAKGLKQQRELTSRSSPFVQACFSNPGNCFIKAAKAGIKDDLQGSLDALAWGKVPAIGTGKFDIIYSGKGFELSKPVDVYNLLGGQIVPQKQNTSKGEPDAWSSKFDEYSSENIYKFGPYAPKKLGSILKSLFSYNDIRRLFIRLRKILNEYPINHQLNEADKEALMTALYFHPRGEEKIGVGAQHIKVINHPVYQETRCFSLVRTDGSVEDFSYLKCVHGALEIIAPNKAKSYQDKYLQNRS